MRSRLALSMAAATVVAAPLITMASASASTSASISAQPVRGQAIAAAPAVSKPGKPHKPGKPGGHKPGGNKKCGYPTNRPNVYLGPRSQTVDEGQRAAAVGWAGCNGNELEGAAVDLHVSGPADGTCSDTGGQGVFRCSTSHLAHNSVAFATVAGSRSNGIKIRVER